MPKITNGDIAKDTISGYRGIVICESVWIAGCRRLTIQPKGLNKENKPFDSLTFDEDQLELIEPIKDIGTPTGGPMPEPVRTTDPK